ncbi:MAG: DUF4249 family protein [Bacteroidales bacterium]|nr:DUF4249 family protein [Bacteroidales bacterium]
MKKIIYISFIFLVLTQACTEPFDVALESTHIRLVVQGSISDVRTAHQVSLTKSADYFSNAPAPKVTGATVSINDGENTFDLTEISDGLYETDTIVGEIGKTYTLTINSEGETYTASSRLNYCTPIDSINFGFYDYSEYYEEEIDSSEIETEPYLSILLNAQEPNTPNDFYLWKIYKNGVLESDTLDELNISDDYFANGDYLYDVEVQWYEEAIVGDTITLEMQAISEDYYNYINGLLTETVYNLGPLGGPPANAVGNISNDAMGFFLAYSVVQITKIVPEKEEWIELEWF